MIAILVWLVPAALVCTAVVAFVRKSRLVLTFAAAALVVWVATLGSLVAVIISLVVVCGAVLEWGLAGRRPARGLTGRSLREHRLPGTPLQTTLFRTVLVALFALFVLVAAVLWWNDRRQNESLSAHDQSLAQLDLAYVSQPFRDVGSSSEPSAGVPFGGPGTGLWIDAKGYRAIRDVIERTQSSPQTFLLDGREQQSAKVVLPSAAYAEWKAGSSQIGIPGYSFPDQLLGLPIEAGGKEMREARGPWLAYIKEHGWRVGWANGFSGRVQYAMWRTGANTAAYVEFYPAHVQSEAWYLRPIQWGLQALFLYALLTPFAAVAAWYLRRRIVRPVAQVAEASAALAAGDRPEPIPEEGPSELRVMARSFNTMARELEQAKQAQSAFVASVSHELKTPLTSLEGYGELLADGAVEAGEAGHVVLSETARLKRLVGDLLDSGRFELDGFSVRLAPVPLQRVAHDVERRYQEEARHFGVELTVKLEGTAAQRDGSGPWVDADEGRLVQVLSNLVENALRCTTAGGEVEIVVGSAGALSVRDTGLGLAPEDLPHVFERFYLYDRYGKDRSVGTGLGLSIVKELVEAMDGEVTVASEPGAGSVFTIRLSLAGSGSGETFDTSDPEADVT